MSLEGPLSARREEPSDRESAVRSGCRVLTAPGVVPPRWHAGAVGGSEPGLRAALSGPVALMQHLEMEGSPWLIAYLCSSRTACVEHGLPGA